MLEMGKQRIIKEYLDVYTTIIEGMQGKEGTCVLNLLHPFSEIYA